MTNIKTPAEFTEEHWVAVWAAVTQARAVMLQAISETGFAKATPAIVRKFHVLGECSDAIDNQLRGENV